MKKVEEFQSLVDHYEYELAARMYYDWAYMHRSEFNKILNEKNVKEKIIDLMYRLEEYGEYTDQI